MDVMWAILLSPSGSSATSSIALSSLSIGLSREYPFRSSPFEPKSSSSSQWNVTFLPSSNMAFNPFFSALFSIPVVEDMYTLKKSVSSHIFSVSSLTRPYSPKSITDLFLPNLILSSSLLYVSVGGSVFGMSRTVVMPPQAALTEPV